VVARVDEGQNIATGKCEEVKEVGMDGGDSEAGLRAVGCTVEL